MFVSIHLKMTAHNLTVVCFLPQVEEILPEPSATELVSIFTTNTYSYATTEGFDI